MSIMLETDKLIRNSVFIDSNSRPFYFHGQFSTSNRVILGCVFEFCDQNNISYKFKKNEITNEHLVDVLPSSLEEAWLLFHQPFNSFIFSIDLTYFHNKKEYVELRG